MSSRPTGSAAATGEHRADRGRADRFSRTRRLVSAARCCAGRTAWWCLEDRHGKRRSFPFGGGPALRGPAGAAQGPGPRPGRPPPAPPPDSVAGPAARAKTALPSRIYVEGRHDAELVEQIWGDDLRHVGAVVEYLGGVDDLRAIVADFAPERGRRLGVLVDHLVPGSKESRIADQVRRGGPVITCWCSATRTWTSGRRSGRPGSDSTSWPDHPARRGMEARHLRGPGLAACRPGRHRRRLEDDLGPGAVLDRSRTTAADHGRATDRLRHPRSSTGLIHEHVSPAGRGPRRRPAAGPQRQDQPVVDGSARPRAISPGHPVPLTLGQQTGVQSLGQPELQQHPLHPPLRGPSTSRAYAGETRRRSGRRTRPGA